MDVTRSIRREKQQRAIQVFGHPKPPRQDAPLESFTRFAGKKFSIQVRLDVTRCERVDADSVPRDFRSQRPCQVDQRRLRGAIRRDLRNNYLQHHNVSLPGFANPTRRG